MQDKWNEIPANAGMFWNIPGRFLGYFDGVLAIRAL
jgi:hypothetical protein